MMWDYFTFFSAAAALCWAGGAFMAMRERKADYSRAAMVLMVAGLAVFCAFIAALWATLGRPPLRTMGETRLWYSFFMIVSGLLTYRWWHYRWILLVSVVMALVFVVINLLKPEIHDQTLMPALQSLWFVPHVTVYMFSYAVLGCAFLLGVAGLFRHTDRYLPTCDRLVSIGLAFLTFGMLSGALWAKEAWGNFWTWDPKEVWAAVTWSVYLLYVHMRLRTNRRTVFAQVLLVVGFVCMQMCWYGVNYLPWASESMHVYS